MVVEAAPRTTPQQHTLVEEEAVVAVQEATATAPKVGEVVAGEVAEQEDQDMAAEEAEVVGNDSYNVLMSWVEKAVPLVGVKRPERLRTAALLGNWPDHPALTKSRKLVEHGVYIPHCKPREPEFEYLWKVGRIDRRYNHHNWDSQIQEYFDEGVLLPESPNIPCYGVNPMFPVPKKDPDKVRVTTDFRHCNEWLKRTTKLKLISTRQIADLIPPTHRWATQIDLKDAYNHIPVNERLQPLMHVMINGRRYRWRGLGFGMSHSPKVFCKLLRATMAPLKDVLQSLDVLLLDYLDDLLLVARDAHTAAKATRLTLAYLECIGWTINLPKSNVTPHQQPMYLGMIWDL